MSTKVIVSNQSALKDLYGDEFIRVTSALEKLIAADKGKGFENRVVYLDDNETMPQLQAPIVTDPANQAENKASIDAVYNALTPDYLMILGSPDIIPHQHLTNPVQDDEDPDVPSDLPYASENKYSNIIRRFINPTRVVGRLSGIRGDKDPSALITGIESSINLEMQTRDKYTPYFAVSAKVWEGSTTQSVTNIFSNTESLQFSPPSGPDWTDGQLSALTHFVNCHGGDHNPNWYGQDSDYNYPIACESAKIDGKLTPGTIAAAECCYGAQLYDPTGVGGEPGICNRYLQSKACAFVGSTTIAYGPADGQGEADLITQYFINYLLNGSSTGRALLEARQQFIKESGTMDPVNQKTIAQFLLLGDPSCHPVFSLMPVLDLLKLWVPWDVISSFQRTERRKKLMVAGKSLPSSIAVANLSKKSFAKPTVKDTIDSIVKQIGLKETTTNTFQVSSGALHKKSMAAPGAQEIIHLVYGKQHTEKSLFPPAVILLVKEQNGQVVSARTVLRK